MPPNVSNNNEHHLFSTSIWHNTAQSTVAKCYIKRKACTKCVQFHPTSRGDLVQIISAKEILREFYNCAVTKSFHIFSLFFINT